MSSRTQASSGIIVSSNNGEGRAMASDLDAQARAGRKIVFYGIRGACGTGGGGRGSGAQKNANYYPT